MYTTRPFSVVRAHYRYDGSDMSIRAKIFGTRDQMGIGADVRGGSPLVSFDHVIDPHFVTFSSSLYTTIRNPNPNLRLTLTLTLTLTVTYR